MKTKQLNFKTTCQIKSVPMKTVYVIYVRMYIAIAHELIGASASLFYCV